MRQGLAWTCALSALLWSGGPIPSATHAAPSASARPKVCLVLSGGGARGAAHIGVLKVLEEMRVPIDCIAATSAGSIVGGAYSSGTPLREIESTMASLSTAMLFTDMPPREERAMRLKEDDLTNLSPVELGLRGGDLLMPKGGVSGVRLEGVLRSLSKVRGFHRFDDLPIRFRALATDLGSGQAVVLDQGDLATAMRASMSVPAAIEPVRLEGRLLVDGGLTNNLPVDVARAMGADIVIAVNLGTPLAQPETLNSLLSITSQMVGILTEQNVRASLASLKPTDILILPNLGDFSAADFDRLALTVPVGEAAAYVVADRLAALSVSPAEYESWTRRRLGDKPPPLGSVDEIRFAPMTRVNPETARTAMQSEAGKPLDNAELDQDMRRLYGTGDFEHVSYKLLDEPGKRVLAVDAVEKSWGPDYLRMGLGLSSDFGGDAYFNLLASYRKTWLNRLGGEWRSDVQVGQTNRLSTEFYQPLSTRHTWFVVPSAGYERRSANVYQGDQRIARYDFHQTGLVLETGAQFTRYGEARLGLAYVDGRNSLDTGPPQLEGSVGRLVSVGPSFRMRIDQLDNVHFPREGYAGTMEVVSSLDDMGGDMNYTRGEISGNASTSWGSNTFSNGFKAGGRLDGSPLPTSRLFQWGGLLQQSGYPTGALMGEELLFGRVVYLRRLHRSLLIDGVYVGGSLEMGRMDRPLIPGNEQGWLRSAAALLGVDTPVGPLYLGYGRADRGYDSLYLFLGRP